MNPDHSRYVQLIESLSEKMRACQFDEIEIADGAFQVRLKRAQPGGAQPASASPRPMTHAETPPSAAPQTPAAEVPRAQTVTAEMSGIVHLQSAPGAAPFVTLGVPVQEGQELCLIEAMKLFSPMASPLAGILSAIHVESGQEIAYGDRLFTIAPAGTEAA